MEENNMNQSGSEANGILMKDFNNHIKQINFILELIKQNNENIKQLNSDYEKATLTSKEKGIPFIIINFFIFWVKFKLKKAILFYYL